jgi:hypothetical protein
VTTPLRVLQVEDSEDDAAIEVIELRRAGFEPVARRVDNRGEMILAIAQGPWEVVLCDHAMPTFNSTRALQVLREHGLDIPLIIVSGMMGEDVAVEALKMGAADYVLKGNLRRLGPAVTRALKDAEERRRVREVEEGLRRNIERQRAILEALPLALYTARLSGSLGTNWITDNAERLSGFPLERFTGEEAFREMRVHPEDLPAYREALRGLGSSGSVAVEYRWQTADGRWRWFLDHATVVAGQDAGPKEILGVWVDITDRKLLEQQLRQAQKMEAIGRLAGGVAHDFNNLLTVILGYSDLLLGGLAEGHPGRGQLEEIRKAGVQAASLTRQLLAFSRRQVLQMKAFDLNRTVADMEKMIRRLVGEDVQVGTSLAPALGSIRADPGQVEQVIMNLVVNARDAMPRGGSLTIETANLVVGMDEEDGLGGNLRPGSFAALSVTDTGVGMDAETRKRIFEPFFTTKPAGKGTGLGLATVHGIVVQSGGQLGLRTEPGRGTTFRVLFPLTAEVLEATDRSPPEVRRTASGTILLVEDEPSIRDIVSRTLQQAGYEVQSATSAEAALAVLLQEPGEPLALLLTDLVLPGMNGFELVQRFRAARPGVPVLGMTGYIDREVHDGALGAALDGLLQKPFRPEDLLRRVAEAIAKRR